MDKEWSEKNKRMQALLGREETFAEAIALLTELRADIFEQITQIIDGCPEEAFYQMPFAGADGYHSKTLSYSIWHIFRIEDIVAHEIIAEDEQVLFRDGYAAKINAPLITTGNELKGARIADFSRQLNRFELYNYAKAVRESTDAMLRGLRYTDLKRKPSEGIREKLRLSGCVSADESAAWLIDYWCGKDIKGLIRMPFSRHHIMHVEAMRRIKNRLCEIAKKGVNPVACCGLSCRHCFLSEWCGSCRTNYNVCSFATCSEGGVCKNVSCCAERGYEGCWCCPELLKCEKGFYVPGNDGAAAAKAQSLYIQRHGQAAFLKLQDRLHGRYNFSKVQEILGQDVTAALEILEQN